MLLCTPHNKHDNHLWFSWFELLVIATDSIEYIVDNPLLTQSYDDPNSPSKVGQEPRNCRILWHFILSYSHSRDSQPI